MRRSCLDRFTSAARLVPLADLVSRVEAGKSYGSASRPADDHEWGIVKVSAMTWGEFRSHENKVVSDMSRVDPRFEIKAGDLLVSRANTTAYVGASVLVGPTRQRLLLSDKSLRLLPRPGVSAEYVHALLQAPRTRSQISALATGTKDSMRNISQGALLSVQVPDVKPELQAQVVQRLVDSGEALARLSSQVSSARLRWRRAAPQPVVCSVQRPALTTNPGQVPLPNA